MPSDRYAVQNLGDSEIEVIRDAVTCGEFFLSGAANRLNALTADLNVLTAERDRLRDEALRYYHSDGTFDVLPDREAVVARRIEAAGAIEKLTAERDYCRKAWFDYLTSEHMTAHPHWSTAKAKAEEAIAAELKALFESPIAKESP